MYLVLSRTYDLALLDYYSSKAVGPVCQTCLLTQLYCCLHELTVLHASTHAAYQNVLTPKFTREVKHNQARSECAGLLVQHMCNSNWKGLFGDVVDALGTKQNQSAIITWQNCEVIVPGCRRDHPDAINVSEIATCFNILAKARINTVDT